MTKSLRFFFIVIPVLFSAFVYGQDNGDIVRFKNGVFKTGKKLARGSFDKRKIDKALYADSYFVLLQFNLQPDAIQQKKLKESGIILEQYVSGKAFLASVNKNFDFNNLFQSGIATVNVVPDLYKTDKEIIAFEPSVNKQEKKLFAVCFYQSFGKKNVESALIRAGAIIEYNKVKTDDIIFIQADKSIVDSIVSLPFVTYISVQNLMDKPLNYNDVASHGISGLYSVNGKNLSGRGVTLGVGDNADISTHIDFSGRLINRTAWIPQVHGTHTSGTAAGAGIIDIKNHGVAPKATIVSQYFSDIITNAPAYFNDYNMVVTNNSYFSVDVGCPGEGEYDVLSKYADEQIKNYDQLLHVIASGNDGDLTCSPYPAQFGTVKSGWQCAKNVLTVGAIKAQDNTNASFSSRGPSKDGRLKPEICAGGWDTYSTYTNNEYGYGSGTSMAAPVVTGALALMNERYRQLHSGNNPKSALMKAIACNTAEDLGNPGPDFTFGFGKLNVRRSIDVIDSSKYFINTVSAGENKQHTITIPSGTAQVKIMLYWADKEAPLNTINALVNDLDLTVTDPSSFIHHPLILNSAPANVNDYAIEGVDRLNNIEQVVISNPVAGNYTINVDGFSVPFGAQEYIVTYEILKPSIVVEYPFGGETLVPGDQETIRWNAVGTGSNSFNVEYSANNGAAWLTINSNVTSSLNYYTWTVPSTITDSALVRVSVNSTAITDQSDFNFTVIGRPEINLSNECEGYVKATWNSIAGATAYDVMVLDNDSMKVVTTLTDTTWLLTGLDKNKTYWVGVRAKIAQMAGRRSISKSIQPNGGACSSANFNNDIKIDSIIEPTTARNYFSNAGNATMPVKIRIKNLGVVAITTPFTVSYTCEGGSATETVSAVIPAGGAYTYTFTTPYTFNSTGFHYHFTSWASNALDLFHNNDTAFKSVSLLQNEVINTLPQLDGFENTTVATYNNTAGFEGDDALDFSSNSTRGRARTYVNSDIARTGNRAITLDQSPYNETANNDTLTVTYNLQSYIGKQLRFDFYYKNHGQTDSTGNKVWIRGSENDNWLEAYDLFENQADLPGWKQGVINVNEVLNSASPAQSVSKTFQIKFGEEGNTSANTANPEVDIDDGYTFDDFKIKEVFNDIASVKIFSPARSDCSLTATNPIGLRIKNYSDSVLHNLYASYQVNGGAIITEHISSIDANQAMDFTFTQTADLSQYQKYTIKAWVNFSGDNYPDNDTTFFVIHSSPLIDSFPYLQRFENSDGDFYTEGKNSTWEWGVPVKTVINKAANGLRAWVTSLTDHYNNNETSYLYSPCFDLAGLSQPVLSFAHIFDVEMDYDYTWVEYSTDGVTWQKLGATGGGTNWYDNVAANNWRLSKTIWHVASLDIPVTGTVVRFRFVLSSDAGVTEDGVGIDDVHIFDKQSVYADTAIVSVSANVAGNNWVHFVSGGKRIASVNSHGQDLGNTIATVYPHRSFILNRNGRYYLGRDVVIKPSFQPTDSVKVRVYFTDDEVNKLLNAPKCDTCALPVDAFELGVIKFSGITENGSLEDNISGNYKLVLPDSTDIIPYDNGYYAEFSVNKFSEFWLSKAEIEPALVLNCTGNQIYMTAAKGQSTYQWQVNTGAGFVNVLNGVNYSGVSTDTLKIFNLSASATGTLYRCLVNGSADNARTLRFSDIWTGTADTNWFNPVNWSCGSVPDQFTDVIILQGATHYPVVPSNASVRTIRLQQNTSVNVNSGTEFQIKGD